MPRKARLDAPGTLHHIIIKGIEMCNIFNDDFDRDRFVTRMGEIAEDTDTAIYAWVLMPNHVHLLIKSGKAGISTFMRRLLSGYAIYYNKKHKRHGHLFQNRYKSIVCDEDVYFTELVRYIHLNPLRAGIVKTYVLLKKYKWCGHAIILKKQNYKWQDREYVLKWFGSKEKAAMKKYQIFVKKGISLGKRDDLTGGGLIRSMGGWSVVKSVRASGVTDKCDERILGSGQFVNDVISQADVKVKYQLKITSKGNCMSKDIKRYCKKENVKVAMLTSGSRRVPLPKIRAELALKFVNKYGVTLAETARRLGISTSGIAQILKRN